MARGQDYITIARQNTKALWDAVNNLEMLQEEWAAADYTNTLPAGEGDNAGVTVQEVSDVVNSSIPAIRAFLTDNFHRQNLVKLL